MHKLRHYRVLMYEIMWVSFKFLPSNEYNHNSQDKDIQFFVFQTIDDNKY